MLFCDLSVIHGLAERTLEALGMLENVLEKPYALGIIVAVCKALVDRKTEIDAVAVFILTVFVAEDALLHFADNDEKGGRAPVGEVVVAASELY